MIKQKISIMSSIVYFLINMIAVVHCTSSPTVGPVGGDPVLSYVFIGIAIFVVIVVCFCCHKFTRKCRNCCDDSETRVILRTA